MSEKERLTMLLERTPNLFVLHGEYEAAAEYLIENGAIAPPCKVGDTVYIPYLSTVIEKKVYSIVIQKPFYTVYCGGTSLRFFKEDFGKTVFLTREDAEKEIERRRQSNA